MKTLHLGMIVVVLQCIFCFVIPSASALYSNGTLDLEKISDSTVTQLEFNNSVITFEQYLNKTTYKVGETIYVYGQLHNNGTRNVYVSYPGPATSSVLKDQSGKLVDSFGGAYVLDGGPYGNATLYPNTTTTLKTWDFPRNVVGGWPWSLQIRPDELVADKPGIYYVKSMVHFNYDIHTISEHRKTITLWSKPLQITVLPERYMQNQTGPSQGTNKTASLQETLADKQEFVPIPKYQNPDVSNAIVLAEVEIPIAAGITVGIFLFTKRPK
ncbi:hypothetical protein [Candidatus Nitrosotalea okcheonensis]|uniref:Uncharacterized protein n=1 Tax=Candidatus Nitrosotalea okcheonensis TaxID=1903276 RepID=A0A2H1FCI4_9ARCH|nr:hypothetical protein [Candidatus Nitrosotalea okcheonensis]SMH70359.1 exported protein of unknown function [Candidatus Nitrosotalea okcheonensis]